MHEHGGLAYRGLRTPRGAGIAGVIFSVLFGTSLVLLRTALDPDLSVTIDWDGPAGARGVGSRGATRRRPTGVGVHAGDSRRLLARSVAWCIASPSRGLAAKTFSAPSRSSIWVSVSCVRARGSTPASSR
jgi:hypothetical protein